MEYYKDGTARVLQLMKDTFGNEFRQYFDGEVEMLAEIDLPCVMMSTPRIEVESGATGTDDITEQVQIIMAVNKKDDIFSSYDQNLTDARLRKYIYGQYPESHGQAGQYVEQSVMYALRKHISLLEAAVENRITVQLEDNIRGENTLTREAVITLTIQRMAMVPSRD